MPWDATSLKVADLGNAGSVKRVKSVVDASDGEAVMQPSWTRDGRLNFISDRSGWWNLYRSISRSRDSGDCTAFAAEIGKPAWYFGARSYAVMPIGASPLRPTRAAADVSRSSIRPDRAVGERSTATMPTPTPYTTEESLGLPWNPDVRRPVRWWNWIRSADECASYIVHLENSRILDYTSKPQSIEFAGAPMACRLSPGSIRPPTRSFAAQPGSAPPVIVSAHGGPTAHSSPRYFAWRSFWTSRGFGVLDVNYSGSSGFGTAYRKRLNGRWGELDVRDVVAAAKAIANRGLGDSRKLIVSGGSAGGFIVLASLAFYPDVFAAGLTHSASAIYRRWRLTP